MSEYKGEELHQELRTWAHLQLIPQSLRTGIACAAQLVFRALSEAMQQKSRPHDQSPFPLNQSCIGPKSPTTRAQNSEQQLH